MVLRREVPVTGRRRCRQACHRVVGHYINLHEDLMTDLIPTFSKASYDPTADEFKAFSMLGDLLARTLQKKADCRHVIGKLARGVSIADCVKARDSFDDDVDAPLRTFEPSPRLRKCFAFLYEWILAPFFFVLFYDGFAALVTCFFIVLTIHHTTLFVDLPFKSLLLHCICKLLIDSF